MQKNRGLLIELVFILSRVEKDIRESCIRNMYCNILSSESLNTLKIITPIYSLL